VAAEAVGSAWPFFGRQPILDCLARVWEFVIVVGIEGVVAPTLTRVGTIFTPLTRVEVVLLWLAVTMIRDSSGERPCHEGQGRNE
jgi:hypothetical protein